MACNLFVRECLEPLFYGVIQKIIFDYRGNDIRHFAVDPKSVNSDPLQKSYYLPGTIKTFSSVKTIPDFETLSPLTRYSLQHLHEDLGSFVFYNESQEPNQKENILCSDPPTKRILVREANILSVYTLTNNEFKCTYTLKITKPNHFFAFWKHFIVGVYHDVLNETLLIHFYSTVRGRGQNFMITGWKGGTTKMIVAQNRVMILCNRPSRLVSYHIVENENPNVSDDPISLYLEMKVNTSKTQSFKNLYFDTSSKVLWMSIEDFDMRPPKRLLQNVCLD